MSAYTPDDPEQLTYEEMESERDRLAMELYHSQIEAEQLRAERDALLPLAAVIDLWQRTGVADHLAVVEALNFAVDALQPTEGAQP